MSDSALMNQLLTANIDAEGLFDNEGFLDRLEQHVLTDDTIRTGLDAIYVNIAGDTMTGPLSLSSDPTDPTHAVTMQYVNANCQTAYQAALLGGYVGTQTDFYADLGAMDNLAAEMEAL